MADPTVPYTYGDSEVAGDRLALLAQVFEPSTATFLRAAAVDPGEREPGASGRPALAVDLGCGPGHTTRLLAQVVEADRTVGLEVSQAFAARARAEAIAKVMVHDVTTVPFPVRPADVLFARYLLAHLPRPERVVDAWTTELTPGGRLLVEEIVAIETDHPVLGRYADIVTAQAVAQGTDLLVGDRLARGAPPAGTAIVHDETVTIAPDVAQVATLFAMNLGEWGRGAWAQETLDPAELDELATALAALVSRPPARGAIQWHHRQLALERAV